MSPSCTRRRLPQRTCAAFEWRAHRLGIYRVLRGALALSISVCVLSTAGCQRLTFLYSRKGKGPRRRGRSRVIGLILLCVSACGFTAVRCRRV
jgi:hypothetical protein